MEFRVLGAVDLRAADGSVVQSVLAQPKRLALLAYLALAKPRGFHRRDVLVSIFWPDTDSAHARTALRKAVHYLRHALGNDVVIGRGDEELGLGNCSIWCDATAFEDAVAAGRREEALALYRGDLLPGLFVTGAPEFENWLDSQRTTFRRQAVEAAWLVAQQKEAAGEARAALVSARTALSLAGADEDMVRRVLQLHERLGDRCGALRCYADYRQWLATQYDLAPSEETEALAEAMRRQAKASHETTVTDDEPAVLTKPRRRFHAALPRRWTVAAALGGLLLVATTGVLAVRSRAFGLQGDADSNAEILRRETASLAQRGSGDVTTQSLVALRFYEEGLRAYYQGDGVSALRLFLSALEEDSSFAMAAYYAGNATSGDFATAQKHFEHAAKLAERASERERLLTKTAWLSWVDDPGRLAAAETMTVRHPNDPDAQYYRGQALLSDGNFQGALPHLQRALELDTLGLRQKASRCRACDALGGMVMAHLMSDSLAAAERVARFHVAKMPQSVGALDQLAVVLEAQGRNDEALATRQAIQRIHPSSEHLEYFPALLAIREADFERADAILQRTLLDTNPGIVSEAQWYSVISLRYQGRLGEALRAAQTFRFRGGLEREPGAKSLKHALPEAIVRFEAGDYRRAAALFDSIAPKAADALPFSLVARHRTWVLTHVATALAAAGDTAAVRVIADSIARLGLRSGYGRDRRLHHHLRGLIYWTQGDPARAADSYRRAIFSTTNGYTRTNLELARSLLELGRAREAIPVLKAAFRGPLQASNLYVTHTELHELLGHAFEAVGQPDSARVHYAWVLAAWRNADPQFRLRKERIQRLLLNLDQRVLARK